MTETQVETDDRKQSEYAQQNKKMTNAKLTNDKVQAPQQQVDSPTLRDNSEIALKPISNEKIKTENITDDFDWVAFVNQVKDLSAPSDSIPNDLYVEDKSSALDIFAQTMSSLNSDNNVVVITKPVDAYILNAGACHEFL